MDIITIICLALSLSMDAFAVSVASGVIIKNNKHYHALKLGLSFGFFQMAMPLLGWASGLKLRPLLEHMAPWVAFGLLTFIGVKMIYEAVKMEALERSEDSLTLYVLLGLSVATSMDALAVGFSFAMLRVAAITPALIIGMITFFMCYGGFLIGRKFGHIFEKKIEIAGGLILIAIGLKILIQHLGSKGAF